MSGLVRRWFAVSLAWVLVVGFLTVGAQPVAAATQYGNDVSWPQCSVAAGGFGLPLPPASAKFVVIGLTKGLPFTENPCLASQVNWAKTNAKPAQAYTLAAFPTTAQLASYGSRGPWSTRTRAGQLSNVGYSEARFAAASLQKTGFAAPVVWIDVEPRTAQPWPTGGGRQQSENRYVIEGLMRGLHDVGRSYGLYSYTSAWQSITGSWRLPGVPVWATAGRLDYPTEALDRCTQPSFSAGHVYLAQWYDDVRDYDLTCGTYAFGALPVPAASLSGSTSDFDGNWNSDVLARVSATAALRMYAGNGHGSLLAGVQIGAGWNSFNALETPGDFSGDGRQDVLARETSTGYLWLYPGNGHDGWLPRVRVGSDWNAFSTIVGPGDFNGDQLVDVLARERATGYLWLYPGNGHGGWLPRVRVGSGWNIFNAIVGPGDFNGDGTTDVLARETASGNLWLYPGNGTWGWLPRVLVGHGWQSMTALLSPGDLSGDRASDVLARDGSGVLWLYPGNGSGGWLSRVRAGSGWNGINPAF
ncbi:VCBS repeat-containing protein [Paenarthrobacter sp. Z7-10]|uniref:FG-GAP-like repeat-containing protein n=1 Tax=Paenarthrobacter sp. Z7-10 TaxID=2787635 RepID=UPI0022A9A306|nr:FG-GAP-like repeat-containing protein [Paenarthrobacter sp. Z7-10]MCZ2402222.1 VCBS repeat-containing protein [Paenarthrobacter sp. Z7-10]